MRSFLPMRSIRVSVLLCDAFSNMVLACLLEPLRVVRDQTGADVRWNILTEGDRAVSSSSGLSVSPEMLISDTLEPDLVIIIGGDAFRNTKGVTSARSLGRLMQGATVIAADTGAWILAQGGFLNARKATLHWQLLEEFAEEFPKVEVLPDRHVQDGRFWTCGSAAAALDLMLLFIRERFGASVAFDAGAMFLHDNARRHGASYPDQALSQAVSPKLKRVVVLMSEALEKTQPVPSLAEQANISERSLRRLFWTELQTTPGRYYLLLRLARARELLRYSDISLDQIALRCGFANATTLTRSLRKNFSSAPLRGR
ncbi:helix-turn-helix domain-containing protein [Ruegeria pomeroyi]|nr:helix-turn-helix domain-containing protein [Ruegeria pomeroyi]NVK97715.1 helix-turn-helix domain-containing protein [Ruegeria pomeroyi]NVL03941.1 helix-turn-helix domain-containing protein [Ruegeria pomeroyi]QWV08559.1 helix-turn-helix domain-containing protein [Ruegeria pomeroyi]HCE70632.1 AraC family transcriptional regulator [Ruegeria sp.]